MRDGRCGLEREMRVSVVVDSVTSVLDLGRGRGRGGWSRGFGWWGWGWLRWIPRWGMLEQGVFRNRGIEREGGDCKISERCDSGQRRL